MRNISPLLLNMPTDMAEMMTQIGKEHSVSRTKVILKACSDFLGSYQHNNPPQRQNEKRGWFSSPKTQKRSWLDREDQAPPAFFSSSGTGF